MLFIYRVLPVGGIETFFLRMAKERARVGLPTAILLLSKPSESNQQLLTEIRKYAKVIFIEDLFINIPFYSRLLPIVAPVKINAVKQLFEQVDQIHVFDGIYALLGYRFTQLLGINLPITIGVYHYIKYLWGGSQVAFHEKINRSFIFDYLPEQSLLFFSEGTRQLYIKHKKKAFTLSNTFRLGVVDKKELVVTGNRNEPLTIIAIGRLVDFKTYNFYMIDVIQKLKDRGYKVNLDIYGDGPLQQKIQDKIDKLSLNNQIKLHGTLEYSEFDETVSAYDLFIGSGTAIIQAAALGIPSIVGVENVIQSKTYGYFSDVYQYEYNMKGLDLPLVEVESLILNYSNMTNESRLKLKKAHLASIEGFTNKSCQESLAQLSQIQMPLSRFKYNCWIYAISYAIDMLNKKFNGKHPKNTQFETFKKLNEN